MDQRQYQRCTVTSESPTAVLTYDRTRVPCWMVEMSLGGFAVLVPTELQAAVNSLARLQVQGLEYIVRLTRQESLGDCFLIGMERIEEVLPDITTVPAGPISKGLTAAFWVTALATIAVAVHFLTAWYS